MNRDKDTNDLDNQKSDVERTTNAKDKNQKRREGKDISDVDRQEGEMNNGELGGDFKERKDSSGNFSKKEI